MNTDTSTAGNAPSAIRRVFRSVYPDAIRRTRPRRFLLRNLALHFRPVSVPEKTLRLSLTWALGGSAAVIVLMQFGTGVLLKFVYEPTPVGAYGSVATLVDGVPFGRLVRNLHYWGAHILVAVALLHLLRVFFTGAFHAPRQFNWVVGLAMFGILLLANLTGYLLPWDQLAYWAVTVSTGMLDYVPLVGGAIQEAIRGGTDIGAASLRIFFAVHTAVIPVILAGLMAFHFWRVRKAGGLVVPRSTGEDPDPAPLRVPTVPNLLLREATAALVVMAALLVLATVAEAPLGDPANPGLSPNPTRAPWYFAGLQELLLHLHPVFAVCVLPTIVLAGLLAVPYLNYETDTGGIWFGSPTGRKTAVIAGGLGLLLTPVVVLVHEGLSGAGTAATGAVPMLLYGLAPTIVLLAGLAVVYQGLRRRFAATRNDAVQALFAMLLVAYAVLTVINIAFRGDGMVLRLPW